MSISKKDMKILLKSQQGELKAVLMYQALANVVKDKNDADTFRKLAAEEGHHAAVFHGFTQENLKPKKTLAVFMPILYRLIGKKHLYPLIIKGEYKAADNYAPVAEKFPEIESVKKDEKRHGDIVASLL
ncbi:MULTISPECIES: ferritin family protein [Anaerococcus]|uniref:ferritin family protein n=1 Tax=Anaerococcus TaxID=165779 RepID=UPI001D402A02|nr:MULTISPECIES: ferritin family protein [Anaerococcus]MBS5989381.1 rubrerythrin [Anaerococcus hydrogenalis]MDU4026737.1 ferritin family protein [Anaerococcus sp.]